MLHEGSPDKRDTRDVRRLCNPNLRHSFQYPARYNYHALKEKALRQRNPNPSPIPKTKINLHVDETATALTDKTVYHFI